jgi:hypothetical protein
MDMDAIHTTVNEANSYAFDANSWETDRIHAYIAQLEAINVDLDRQYDQWLATMDSADETSDADPSGVAMLKTTVYTTLKRLRGIAEWKSQQP